MGSWCSSAGARGGGTQGHDRRVAKRPDDASCDATVPCDEVRGTVMEAAAFLSKLYGYRKTFGVKSPSERKRLKRRLEERKRRKEGLPIESPSMPAPKYAPKESTPEERKAVRVQRRTKRINRKLRERQRMAARSGLHELVSRAKGTRWPRRQQRGSEALAGARTRDEQPRQGSVRHAEESHELSLDSRRMLATGATQHNKDDS